MKKCPNCNIYYSEEEYKGCTQCGSDLVSCEAPNHIGNDNIFMDGVHSDNHQETNAELENENSNVKIGNDNTFTGGVHSSDDHTKVNSDNQVHTNSHNTTNNTTIYQAPKSNSEKLAQDELSYRLKCKELFVNGFISKEGEKQLRELQRRLNLADELVVSIKDEIRKQSIKPIAPTAQVMQEICQTKSIIELNNNSTLQRQLKQLESWMGVYDDDTLKLMYYQLSAILEPTLFTNRYENSAKDEYWEAFWAYIAYMKQARDEQSFDARTLSGNLGLHSGKPGSNDVILHLAGRLIHDDPIDDIKKERNTLTAHYSQELQLLLDAIDELLKKDWDSETVNIRPTHSFYVNALFTNFVATQKSAGEERRRENLRISRAEQERQNEIKRQKTFLLKQFSEVEDIEKACRELNIPYLTFREWLEDDLTFNSAYYESVRRIDKIRSEREDAEAKTKKQKSDFKNRYEQNNCDLLKTCYELDVDSYTIGEWRKLDKAFDNALAMIERDNEKKQQETFISRYVSNNCNLQKASAEMGIDIDVVDNWRKLNKAFDNKLCSIEKEYERALHEAFVKCYESYDCNIRKACDDLGIKIDTVNEWRQSNKAFDDELNDLKKKHERIMQEAFIECYKSNNCDLQKSCTKMHITPDDVRIWRCSYKQFDDVLRHLKRARVIQRFKKVLPYILIVCLLIAGAIAIYIEHEIEIWRELAHGYLKE